MFSNFFLSQFHVQTDEESAVRGSHGNVHHTVSRLSSAGSRKSSHDTAAAATTDCTVAVSGRSSSPQGMHARAAPRHAQLAAPRCRPGRERSAGRRCGPGQECSAWETLSGVGTSQQPCLSCLCIKRWEYALSFYDVWAQTPTFQCEPARSSEDMSTIPPAKTTRS